MKMGQISQSEIVRFVPVSAILSHFHLICPRSRSFVPNPDICRKCRFIDGQASGVTSGFFGLLVTPGWREGNSNLWNPLESPQFPGIGVGVDPPFHRWSWNWGIPKIIPKNRNWSVEL